MLWNECYGMYVSPPSPPHSNLYLEALMPNAMVFGNDAFGLTRSQDCASCDGISGLKKEEEKLQNLILDFQLQSCEK